VVCKSGRDFLAKSLHDDCVTRDVRSLRSFGGITAFDNILYVSIIVFNFPPLVGFFENAFCKVNHFFNIKNSNADNVLFF
jgi:hypothetical protein